MTLASLPAPLLAALPAPLLAALPAQRSPSADPSPTVSPDCHQDLVCETVFAVTGLPWLAETSFWIFIKPIRIALIIIVTMMVRYLLHRAINRLVRGSSQAPAPTILRPLRERVRSAIQEGRVLPERRRQRAEAIGSVLRSLVTAVVFSIAFLLVLSELNFNLAPLLASAGIVGVALGFGAQTLVKDLIAGLFMLLEDQYGVGDTVDLGEATGVVEAVGLRITTVRDGCGALWYIRNGEITRVGNKSQGWAMVILDLPIGFAGTQEASAVLRQAAASIAADPALAAEIVEPPEVLGVETITVDGAVIRTVAKTTAEGQPAVAREMRRRLTEALEESGIVARIAETRLYPRPAAPPDPAETGQGGAT